MVRIGSPGEGGLVTGIAIAWCIGVPVYMTGIAGDRGMRSGQREARSRVIKSRWLPGVGAVAKRAIVVELTGNVIWICRCSERRAVTGIAVCRCARVSGRVA